MGEIYDSFMEWLDEVNASFPTQEDMDNMESDEDGPRYEDLFI